MLVVKDLFIRIRLSRLLRSNHKKNYISVCLYDEDRDVVFVKVRKKRNEYFGVRLSEQDFLMIRMYLSDNDFLIYGGIPQTDLLEFILVNKWKWNEITHWYD